MKTVCSHRKRSAGSDGFTFLEVMISVSIIAIIFVSLFRMQSGSISLAETGRFNILAPILAERMLIKIENDILNWSEVEGNFGETYPGFGWTCEIEDVPLHELDFVGKDSNHKLKKIIVTITGSSSRQPVFKTETWRVVFD